MRPYEAVRARSPLLDRATEAGADLMWRRLMPRLSSDEATYDSAHVDTVVKQ